MVEVGIPTDLKPVTERESFKCLRQLVCGWHLGRCDEQWNDERALSCKCELDLDADMVRGIVDPTTARAVAHTEPIWSDDDEHHGRTRQLSSYVSSKVDAERCGVDVTKHDGISEISPQAIEDATGHIGGVLAAVADEDGVMVMHLGIANAARERAKRPGYWPGRSCCATDSARATSAADCSSASARLLSSCSLSRNVQ